MSAYVVIALLGWAVATLDIAQFLPQTRRALQLRRIPGALAGLSVWTWTIVTVQGAAWVIYGFAEHLWAIALPNLLITPAAAVTLVARLRSGRG